MFWGSGETTGTQRASQIQNARARVCPTWVNLPKCGAAHLRSVLPFLGMRGMRMPFIGDDRDAHAFPRCIQHAPSARALGRVSDVGPAGNATPSGGRCDSVAGSQCWIFAPLIRAQRTFKKWHISKCGVSDLHPGAPQLPAFLGCCQACCMAKSRQ